PSGSKSLTSRMLAHLASGSFVARTRTRRAEPGANGVQALPSGLTSMALPAIGQVGKLPVHDNPAELPVPPQVEHKPLVGTTTRGTPARCLIAIERVFRDVLLGGSLTRGRGHDTSPLCAGLRPGGAVRLRPEPREPPARVER